MQRAIGELAMIGMLKGATLSRHHKAKPTRWIMTTEGFGADVVTADCIHAIQRGDIEVVDVTQDPQIYRLTTSGQNYAMRLDNRFFLEFEAWCPGLATKPVKLS